MLFDIMEEIEKAITVLQLSEIIEKYQKSITDNRDYILFMLLLKQRRMEIMLTQKRNRDKILTLIKNEMGEE